MGTYQPGIYREQGGNKLVAKADGTIGQIQFGETNINDNAVCMGAGTSAAPLESASTSKNFMEFRLKHTGASGDIRGMYLREYLAGGAGGEALRAFTTIQAAAGTAHGAHISLNFGDSPATLSGLGVAMRGTLHIPDRAITLGTCAAVQAEVYLDGTSAVPTGTVSLIRGVIDGGDATAREAIKYLMDLAQIPSGSGLMHHTCTDTATHMLRVRIGGSDYGILLTDSP